MVVVRNRLKKARRDMDLTQVEFANFLDISQQQVSKFERQKITNPEGVTMLSIAKKLNMPVESIFYLED